MNGYTAVGDKSLLATISVPGDTNTSFNTCTIRYQDGKVASSTDANGNQHVYTYTPGHCRVEVKGGDGKVAGLWTLNFDTLGRSTGQTDAAGHSTKLAY